MNNIEITNELFEAINIIVRENIRNLPYDRTIVATIINNKEKEYGIYQVRTGKGSIFTAYSENGNYELNDSVYVLIPSGDYSEKKFILSKYNSGQELIDNELIQNNMYISPEGKTSDWSSVIKSYKQNRQKEQSENFLRFFIKQEKTDNIEDLSLKSFGVNFDNLGQFLKETYNFELVSAAIGQYLEAHPELIQAAVDEYLETKE